MNILTRALNVWLQHREFRAVFAKLARHTDRELRDMGIDRGDIARIAYDEAERHIVEAERCIETSAASSSPAIAGYNPYYLAAG